MNMQEALREARSILYSGNPKGLDDLVASMLEDPTPVIKFANQHLSHMKLEVLRHRGNWEIRHSDEFNASQLQGVFDEDGERGELYEPTRFKKISDFIMSNHAKFTILNTRTGNRFLFQVKRPRRKTYIRENGKTVVKRLYQNYMEVLFMRHYGGCMKYIEIGTVRDQDLGLKYSQREHAYKYANAQQKQAMDVFAWLWKQLQFESELPPHIEIWHIGYCCKCGRTLSRPESLQDGIGPICVKKIKDEQGITIPQ